MGDVEAVTWCRVFQQRVCPHPCVDCKSADAQLTDDDRRRLLPERTAP